MVLSANINFRARADGLETNGSGFDPSLTTNMLTDGAATSANTASPIFSSASYTFVAGDVGAAVYIASGTNWTAGWYEIVSVSGGNATLNAAVSTIWAGGILSYGENLITAGCATTASPTGATWSIDYSWRATPWLSLTDLTSTASTTVTSVAGGFHKSQVGNIFRMASGTGATTGYYALTNVTDTNTATFDRASGTYTAGVGKLGGAAANIRSFASASIGLTAPILSSPLAVGHTVWIRGAGSDSPSTEDWNLTGGYYTFTNGDATSGNVSFRGYNGRPMFLSSGITFNSGAFTSFVNIKGKLGASTYSTGFVTASSLFTHARNVHVDTNGYDSSAFSVTNMINCRVTNSGATTAGTSYAIASQSSMANIIDCYIEGVRGGVINQTSGGANIANTIISNCKGTGVPALNLQGTSQHQYNIHNCTINGGASDAILLASTSVAAITYITDCIISNHAGASKTAIKINSGTNALNDKVLSGRISRNNFYGNTANYSGFSGGIDDTALNPQFTNAAGGDFTVGLNMKSSGYIVGASSTTSYLDKGAAQRIEPAGAGTVTAANSDTDMADIPQNTAHNAMVYLTDSSGAPVTGATLTITASKDGGVFSSITPTVTERGNGAYSLALTTTHTNTVGELTLSVSATGGAVTRPYRYNVVAYVVDASVAAVKAQTDLLPNAAFWANLKKGFMKLIGAVSVNTTTGVMTTTLTGEASFTQTLYQDTAGTTTITSGYQPVLKISENA